MLSIFKNIKNAVSAGKSENTSKSAPAPTPYAAMKDTVKSVAASLINNKLDAKKTQFRAIEGKLDAKTPAESKLKTQSRELQEDKRTLAKKLDGKVQALIDAHKQLNAGKQFLQAKRFVSTLTAKNDDATLAEIKKKRTELSESETNLSVKVDALKSALATAEGAQALLSSDDWKSSLKRLIADLSSLLSELFELGDYSSQSLDGISQVITELKNQLGEALPNQSTEIKSELKKIDTEINKIEDTIRNRESLANKIGQIGTFLEDSEELYNYQFKKTDNIPSAKNTFNFHKLKVPNNLEQITKEIKEGSNGEVDFTWLNGAYGVLTIKELDAEVSAGALEYSGLCQSLETRSKDLDSRRAELENDIKGLVAESKSLFSEISEIEYTLSSLEDNEEKVKEETIKILNGMSNDHKKIVLEQMLGSFSESMSQDHNWTRMSHEQQVESFLNDFATYVDIKANDHDLATYREMLK